MKPRCLSEVELRELLTGSASAQVRVSAERHLDTCEHCRAGLESLAGSAEAFRSLHPGNSGSQARPTPALDLVIREFTAAPRGTLKETPEEFDRIGIRQCFTASKHGWSLGRLGDYEIHEVVAAGGMGIVLKALDTNLSRIVALKVLAPVLAADSRARQRFLREARAVAAIHHHHVVGIFAVGEANDLPFLAMEFVEGESLAQRLQRDGRLRAEETIRIGKEVAAGLAAAHARGIIHRDIKPANVLIERATGRIKITDFGLARAVDDTGLTRSGFIAGTPEYLSPEQAADQPLDARSDLFSLGCLLYAACVGESPFQAATTLAVLRRVADHTPLPVCQLNADVPRWFSGIIGRLLEKNPAERFASAEELLKALDTKTPAITENVWESARARLRPALAPLLVLFAVITLAVLLSLPNASRTSPFAVHGDDGQPIGDYADLEQAVRAAPGGATIDLHWNGGRKMAPIELPAKPFTLRAAKNFRPVWVHRNPAKAALTASAPLTVEGIEFRYDPASERSDAQTNVAPTKADRAPQGPPLDAQPSGTSLIRAVGGSLKIIRCLLRREGPFLMEDDGFAGITLQGATNGTVTDTALFLGCGKGLVCRGGQPSIAISNCLFFASQSVWMDPDAPATLRIERSSMKGETLVHFPPPAKHLLTVLARSNLFNTSFIIVDQRPQAPTRLRKEWLNWEDDANLYSLAKMNGNQTGFIRFEAMPNVGPRFLRGWKDFSKQVGADSWEAQAQFAKLRQPGSAAALEPPTFEDFRLTKLESRGGSPLPQPDERRFGPVVTALEMALTSSASPR